MKIIPLCAGLLGAAGVCLGAFGAHALQERLAAASTTEVWDTAVLYHLMHAAMAWIATQGISHEENPARQRAAIAWIVGIVLFSGSLYALALGGPRWMGPITPLGGLSFVLGWIFAAFSGRKSP